MSSAQSQGQTVISTSMSALVKKIQKPTTSVRTVLKLSACLPLGYPQTRPAKVTLPVLFSSTVPSPRVPETFGRLLRLHT